MSALAAEPPEKTFSLSIVRGTLPAEQRLLRVEKGDAVRLRLTSDAPGEIHLHGYRLEAKLTPGTPAELAFKAYATGRYPFEWHGAGDAAKTGTHHGPPLATLEVRPK
jgi:FtsP/CotA-like multicopper oxidase with cupredoxin domain